MYDDSKWFPNHPNFGSFEEWQDEKEVRVHLSNLYPQIEDWKLEGMCDGIKNFMKHRRNLLSLIDGGSLLKPSSNSLMATVTGIAKCFLIAYKAWFNSDLFRYQDGNGLWITRDYDYHPSFIMTRDYYQKFRRRQILLWEREEERRDDDLEQLILDSPPEEEVLRLLSGMEASPDPPVQRSSNVGNLESVQLGMFNGNDQNRNFGISSPPPPHVDGGANPRRRQKEKKNKKRKRKKERKRRRESKKRSQRDNDEYSMRKHKRRKFAGREESNEPPIPPYHLMRDSGNSRSSFSSIFSNLHQPSNVITQGDTHHRVPPRNIPYSSYQRLRKSAAPPDNTISASLSDDSAV